MPSWPPTLPQQLSKQGYGEALPDNVIRTTVDAGPEKRRQRFTAAVRPLRGSMVMTSVQLDTLEAFFGTVSSGAEAFDFPSPRGAGTVSVAFAQPPSWANVGGDIYRVSLEMEIQP